MSSEPSQLAQIYFKLNKTLNGPTLMGYAIIDLSRQEYKCI